MSTLLVISMVLPLLGAAMLWAMAEAELHIIRWAALLTALATAVLAIFVIWLGPASLPVDETAPRLPGEFAVFEVPWLNASPAGVDIRLSLGLDGLSIWLYGLSALLVVTCVLVSWDAVQERAAGFYALLLLLEGGLLGVFAARDLLLFYVFFEFTLIPLFFLIGVWGSEQRRYAAIKFFLFTLAGSVLTFLGLLAIVVLDYHNQPPESRQLTFSIAQLQAHLDAWPLDPEAQFWIFLALFAGFAVKVPLFPLHTWLPLAHVQAPTAGSVLLAGVLLKIGTYGFVRFSIPWLPDATMQLMPWVIGLAVAGIVYGALVSLVQKDMKRLIAYSSVSHLGFCTLGLFALNGLGMQGGVLQMINHGISTGALFALVGMLYERFHTREIRHLGGLAAQTPGLAAFLVLFAFSSIGLPGLNGFAGEFLLLVGMFQRAWTWAPGTGRTGLLVAVLAATSGVVLGAWYLLWLIERILFGKLQQPEVHGPPPRDLRFREVAALAPLAVLVFWIGICPGFFLKPMQRTLQPITAAAERRLPGHRAHSKAALSWSQAPPRPATKPIDDHADEEQALAQ